MPIVNFHLVEGLTTPAQDERLLIGACQLYAEVLKAPMERVRAFITLHKATHFAVAGGLAAHNGLHAPYFEFIVLDGRPLEDRHRLMRGFTDLLVDALGVRRSAGNLAQVLNQLGEELTARGDIRFKPVKEVHGHTTAEVSVGILLGFFIALAFCSL